MRPDISPPKEVSTLQSPRTGGIHNLETILTLPKDLILAPPHPQKKNVDILIAVFLEAKQYFQPRVGQYDSLRGLSSPVNFATHAHLRGRPGPRGARCASSSPPPTPGTRRSPGPCQARRQQRRRERGRGEAPGGGGPETRACSRAFPAPPNPSSARGRLGLARS